MESSTETQAPSEHNKTAPRALSVEEKRYRIDIVKWIIVAVGAVISFVVIDYGKLRLEQFHVASEHEQQLLNAYLQATESAQPDIWKRKLHILMNISSDDRMKSWAKQEFDYIENFAGLDALYRETLKVASQLVEPTNLGDPERAKARVRFNQLYWADLPHAGESREVSQAMVDFRDALIDAEKAPRDSGAWEELSLKLYSLSNVIRESAPKYSSVK